MAFHCFAFRFCRVSIFHIKFVFSSIQISEGGNTTTNEYAGQLPSGNRRLFLCPKKGGRYGLTNHKAAGSTNTQIGKVAVRQFCGRKLSAAGRARGMYLCTASVQERHLLPLLSESGTSLGKSIVHTDQKSKQKLKEETNENTTRQIHHWR